MRDDFSQAQQLTPQNVRDTSVNSCVDTTVLGSITVANDLKILFLIRS